MSLHRGIVLCEFAQAGVEMHEEKRAPIQANGPPSHGASAKAPSPFQPRSKRPINLLLGETPGRITISRRDFGREPSSHRLTAPWECKDRAAAVNRALITQR